MFFVQSKPYAVAERFFRDLAFNVNDKICKYYVFLPRKKKGFSLVIANKQIAIALVRIIEYVIF